MIFGIGIVVARLHLNQGHLIGSIAIDFVGAHVNEHGLGTVLARSFEQVQGADGIYIKIDERNLSSLVVRWLSGAVNNAIEARLTEKREDGFPVADIQIPVSKVASASLQTSEIPSRIACRAEELLPHVVVNAGYTVSLALEIQHGFGANQSIATTNQNMHRAFL